MHKAYYGHTDNLIRPINSTSEHDYLFDNLGPNLFISSRTPTIASGIKIAAIALVAAGLTMLIIYGFHIYLYRGLNSKSSD